MAWADRSGRINFEDPAYLWEQVAADLRREIRSGELGPGSRLPSEAELAEMYGVARGTVRTAIRALREEGLVIVRVGKGAYVRRELPPE